jgi:hypothetical protein
MRDSPDTVRVLVLDVLPLCLSFATTTSDRPFAVRGRANLPRFLERGRGDLFLKLVVRLKVAERQNRATR